jgi:hypothetical protein
MAKPREPVRVPPVPAGEVEDLFGFFQRDFPYEERDLLIGVFVL